MTEFSNIHTDKPLTQSGTESPVPPIPQYYRVKELAKRLALSEKTIIRRLKDDPDVLVMTDQRKGIRKYKTYLVPDVSLLRLVEEFRLRR